MNSTLHRKDLAQDFVATWRRAAGPSVDDAEQHLCTRDSRLGGIIEAVGPQRFAQSPAQSHFDAIARSIIYQQLSLKAAAAIYSRYRDIVSGTGPERVVSAAAEQLRSAGLSAQKIRYLKALATAITDGTLDLDHVDDLPDDEIVSALTKVPGVGVWTAQMFLMFRLQRPDVLPTRDAGIQRGLQLAHGLRNPAAPGYVERAGKGWSPFRSIACLYLWAAVDTAPRIGRPSRNGSH